MGFDRVSPWLVSESPESEKTRVRLFCFPHAGGNATLYSGWGDQLKDSFEVFVVIIPNKYRKVNENTQFENLLTDLVDDILPFFVESPAILFGHSAGAITAWAVGIELQRKGYPAPLRLFASASPSPLSDLSDDWKVLQGDSLQDKEESERLLRAWNGTPDEIFSDPEAFDLIRSKVAFDLSFGDYVTKKCKSDVLKAPISYIQASEDNSYIQSPENDEKWSLVVDPIFKELCTVQKYPGGHFYISEQTTTLLPFITETSFADRDRLLSSAQTLYNQWNGRSMDYPSTQCLHELFIKQAQLTPERIALVDGDRKFTFKRLDYLTDLLAGWLYNTAGVRPNQVTGILMERCAEFVISYIAALKAGGAYMPLEIVYPTELLSRVLEESKPRAVLTKELFQARLPLSQCSLSLNGDWWTKLEQNSEVQPLPEEREKPTPDDLAYIVMSSGTTGIPKGICCPHRGAVHSYHWRHEKYPYQENEREAANIFFVWEVLRPILRGYPAYVIPDEVIYEPFALTDFLERNEITRILFTPSCCQLVLDTFAQTGNLDVLQQKLRHLKIVWLCGEVVTVELCTRFTSLLPDCELLNLYSISECHDVSVGDLRKINIKESPKFAPCGRVMENVEVYVFDSNKEIVPVGMAGEVYVGGPCVGIGYLNRPEQTAQRFVTHPTDPTKRLYRTGDNGKLLRDGTLEILGRCDYMVKIRGYSVVLGAVEVAIASHPLLSTSVVVTEGEEGTDKRLVAYIVPKEWTKLPSNESIRSFLKDQLPHYAIPSCFIPLPQLPLHDASGKLDRKRLPKPNDEMIREAKREIIQPNNDIEKELVSMWKDLLPGKLQENHISTKDDFFDLGGHSLLSMRFITAVNIKYDVRYSLKEFLQNPVITEIAKNIELLQSGKQVKHTKEKISVENDIILDESIYPAATRKGGYSRLRVEQTVKANPSTVFLTGATGFLGAFLLAELLSIRLIKQVFCLVRATNKEEGRDRIRQVLQNYRLLPDEAAQRRFNEGVTIIVGDLSKALFGLENDAFTQLAGKIETIIHCGAMVNLILSYEELKKANVYGTREILRLATTNSNGNTAVKPVHYISTNSVFPWLKGSVCKEIDLEHVDVNELEDGYSQTKWAAERLCIEARGRGLPVAIYRPGNLSGSFKTGASNQNDFIFLLFQGIRILDCSIDPVGEVENWKFDLTPVDWAASAVIQLAVHFPSYSLGDILHLQSPHAPLTAKDVLSFLGTQTKEPSVTFTKWRQLLSSAIQQSEDTQTRDNIILRKLFSSLESTVSYLENSVQFDSSKLLKKINIIQQKETLPSTPLSCPEITQNTLRLYFHSVEQ